MKVKVLTDKKLGAIWRIVNDLAVTRMNWEVKCVPISIMREKSEFERRFIEGGWKLIPS
jgi:hypothetical protein